MKFVTIFVYLSIALIFLSSCEREQDKRKRLGKKLQAVQNNLDYYEHKWERLQSEQKKIYHSSVKEQFAFFYRVQTRKWIALQNERYIAGIKFAGPTAKKSSLLYKITVQIKPIKADIKPYFYVHLYNRRGILLDVIGEKKKLFGGKIPKGHLVEKEYSVALAAAQELYYFRIEFFN